MILDNHLTFGFHSQLFADGILPWVVKMHGAENDFVFMFVREQTFSKCAMSLNNLRHGVSVICNRRTGIGADGVVFLELSAGCFAILASWKGDFSADLPLLEGVMQPHAQQEFPVTIVNSDGSFAGTCGNALRCLGFLLFRLGLIGKDSSANITRMRIAAAWLEGFATDEKVMVEEQGQTFACVYDVQQDTPNPALAEVTIGMGRLRNSVTLTLPVREMLKSGHLCQSMASEKTQLPSTRVWENLQTLALGKAFFAEYVELSNPHVVFCSTHDFTMSQLEELGSFLQSFLPKVFENIPVSNIGFLSMGEKIKLVVYERGAGLTRCCGSGATAAAVALRKNFYTDNNVDWYQFYMPGGSVKVSLTGSEFLLAGPAAFSFVARLS